VSGGPTARPALDRLFKAVNTAAMPSVFANGIEIFYERFGAPGNPTLLLVSGLGAQSIGYDDELCEAIASLGLDVIRYDNRDVGLSTHFSDADAGDINTKLLQAMMGEAVEAPYTLSDMADDGMGLLTQLGIGSAHLVGASMGGMIVQTMAIEHPERVLTLTSVMSTTGEPEYGTPEPDCLAGLVSIMQPAETHEERVATGVALQKIIGTEAEFDLERVQAKVEHAISRNYDPDGTGRQLLAVLASGSRAEHLPGVGVPTMVLHGDADRLVTISGGHRTAELIPTAEFRQMDGMGHDLPPSYWDRAIGAVDDVIGRAG